MKWPAIVVLSSFALFTAAASGHAQGAGTTKVGVTGTEMEKIKTGWSAKKDILGRVVYNERNERVGTIEDLIIASDQSVSYAIVGAGGFVGLGKHDVAIPLSHFRSENGKFVLPGATKDELQALPAFVYAK